MLSILEVNYNDIESFLVGNNIIVPEKRDFAYVAVLYHLYSQTYKFIPSSLTDVVEEIGCKSIVKINYQSTVQQRLNSDIMLQLCHYLDPYSIVSLCETCKTALSLVQNKDFWNLLIPLLVNNKFDINKLNKNEQLFYAKTYYGKRKSLSIVDDKVYIIDDSACHLVNPSSDCPYISSRNKSISHIIKCGYDYYNMVDGNIHIHWDNEGLLQTKFDVSEKITIPIGNISEYQNKCLYSDYRGNRHFFDNGKLKKIRDVRNLLQIEEELFLNHNRQLFVSGQVILNNVNQITNRYALTTNGTIYEINEGLVAELNINLKNIKQISSSREKELFILLTNGLLYYYRNNELIKDDNLEDIVEILTKDNKLYVLTVRELIIVDLIQNKTVNNYRYDDDQIWAVTNNLVFTDGFIYDDDVHFR